MIPFADRAAVALLAAALSAAVFAPARADDMTAAEIRAEIIGHRIYLAAPMGGEFPLHYRKNGLVDGDGEALGLGRFLAPTETGRWSIDGNQLCQQFKTWYNGARSCFHLMKVGAGSVKWTRDNGETGIARIGD